MRRCVLVILWAAAIFCAPLSIAGGRELLKLAPAEADLVIRVEGASAMRGVAAGEAAHEILLGFLNSDGRTAERWSALSAQLGWSEQQTFDRLFGRSFAIVGERLWSEEAASWALLSVVDRATDARLRKRLPAAPRTIVGGSPVLSLEDGAFEMAMRREGRWTTLVFARRGDSSTFERIASGLEKGIESPLALHPLIVSLDELDVEEIVVWLAPPKEAGKTRVALGGRLRKDRLEFRLISECGEPLPEITPWSIGEWKALAKGSLAAVVERRPDPSEGGGAKEGGAVVGPILELDLLPWLNAKGEEAEGLGERHAIAVHAHPEGGLTVTAGVRLRSEQAAGVGDRMMRRMVSWLSAALELGSWDYDFEGLFPRATRRVRLSEEAGESFAAIGGDGFEVAWTYRGAESDEGGSATTWLMASTAPAEAVRAATALSEGRPGGGVGRWLSVGTVRPAGIFKALEEGGVEVPPPLSGLCLVDLVGWRVEVVGSSSIRGRGIVRFDETGEVCRHGR